MLEAPCLCGLGHDDSSAARTIENQQGELKNKVDDIPNDIEAQVKTQMEKCDATHELEKNIETSKREIQAIKDMSHIFQELGMDKCRFPRPHGTLCTGHRSWSRQHARTGRTGP